jgi:protein-S-isoprenylcysteine O-methyltransferase Ste14
MQRSPQPPLLFLGFLLTGVAFGYLDPVASGLPAALRLPLGILLLVAILGLGGWALLIFKRQHTTPEPNGVATALLTSGPFRWTRNPLYLCLSMLLAWFGIMLDSAWLLALTPLLVLLLDRLVIAREEARLWAQFGDAYLAYTRRVRRWF